MAKLYIKSCRSLYIVMIVVTIISITTALFNVTYGYQDTKNELNVFTNNSDKPVKEHADLTITKTVKNANGSQLTSQQLTAQFIFTVTFSDGREQIITLKHGEIAVIRDIPIGTTYTITENANSNYIVSGSGHQGVINKNGSKAEFINNAKDKLEEKITVKVKKVWDLLTPNDTHPASVKVQLYRNGVAYGTVKTLNADINWTFWWTNLDKNYIWTVDEIDVPDGFEKTVTGNTVNGFVITNTKKSGITPPPPPSETTPPVKPEPPTETTPPVKPKPPPGESGTLPKKPVPHPDPTDPKTPGQPSVIPPKTDDEKNDPRLWLIILIINTFILKYVIFYKKDQELNKET